MSEGANGARRVTFTPQQRAAIAASGGEILVSAAAGSGKTEVLVNRVLERLVGEKRLSITRVLAITFTEAAADSMREKISKKIQERLACEGENASLDPGLAEHLKAQFALLPLAHFSTIHAFCAGLLREHFASVPIDPAFMILDPREQALLRANAFEEEMARAHDGRGPGASSFRDLLDFLGGSESEEPLRALVFDLLGHLDSVAAPDDRLRRLRESVSRFSDGSRPVEAQPWFDAGFRRFLRGRLERTAAPYRELLAMAEAEGAPDGFKDNLRPLLGAWDELLAGVSEEGPIDLALVATRLAAIRSQKPRFGKNNVKWPAGRARLDLVGPAYDKRFEQIAGRFFVDRRPEFWGADLAATAPHLACLLDVAEAVRRRYQTEKERRGGLDFPDLEHRLYEMLTDPAHAEVRERIRGAYDLVLVDEYQDVNDVQDAIVREVSRTVAGPGGEPPNLFMVGDVKQSIYGFREANPENFRGHERRLSDARDGGSALFLPHNFRSDPALLEVVNAIFRRIMHAPDGRLRYEERDELAAAPAVTPPAAAPASVATHDTDGVFEFHVVDRSGGAAAPAPNASAGGEGDGSPGDRRPGDAAAGVEPDVGGDPDSALATRAEWDAETREAHAVVARVRALLESETDEVRDETGGRRRIRPGDVAVLLRSLRAPCEIYLAAFEEAGIPVRADIAPGRFRSTEFRDLLALVRLLWNPLDDLDAATVLHSPIAGLNGSDLARLRVAFPGRALFVAAFSVARPEPGPSRPSPLRDKLEVFLTRYERWRSRAAREPVGAVLERILEETGYEHRAAGLPRGRERLANLESLRDLAGAFDRIGTGGLQGFARWLRALEAEGIEPDTGIAAGAVDDAVTLLSVHKSKGLEFPVVVVAGLGKKFNLRSARDPLLFHRHLGLGSMAVNLEHRLRYPTIVHERLKFELEREMRDEDMRVLYVALTRAKERLLLFGTARGAAARIDAAREERARPGDGRLPFDRIESANTPLDWLLPVLADRARVTEPTPVAPAIVVASPATSAALGMAESSAPLDPVLAALFDRLDARYPDPGGRSARAKIPVTELKRRIDPEIEAEAPFRIAAARKHAPEDTRGVSEISALDRGLATHAVLQHLDLSRTDLGTVPGIEAEIDRMVYRPRTLGAVNLITESQAAAVRLFASAIARFFAAEALGRAMCEHPESVRREVPFLAAVPRNRPDLIAAVEAGEGIAFAGDDDDFLVVQGVIDVCVDTPDGIVVIDWKTDRIGSDRAEDEAVRRHRTQMAIYAGALAAATGRPVAGTYLYFLSRGSLRET